MYKHQYDEEIQKMHKERIDFLLKKKKNLIIFEWSLFCFRFLFLDFKFNV